MSKLKLSLACGDYDRTRALRDGTVVPEGIDLNYIPLRPAETFWRMLNNAEFDASEMSLSSYTILRSQGDTRFIALPVFLSRIFRQSCVYVNTRAGIRRPEDMKGRRFGAADYQMTAAVWTRGFLQHDYCVLPEDMNWVVGAPIRAGVKVPQRVKIEHIGQARSLDLMLEAGEIDALLGVTFPRPFLAGSKRVRRLFPDHRRVEEDYYRRTGIFPIMHTLVLKTSLLEAAPWVAVSLYKAFVQAKQLNYQRLYDTDALPASLPFLIDAIEGSRRTFGDEIWAYSVERSRPTLEALVQYLDEQGLTARRMSVEELFAPNVRPQYDAYLESFYH
jgi:4,5-dihydroxyphthalate decarboxylase